MSDTPFPNGTVPHDYHMHSTSSCDSSATMIEMGESALAHGIHEIAFTEHFDIHPLDSCTSFYQADLFFERIAEARRALEPQGLTIRAGVELGEPHRYSSDQQPVLDQHPYDVVLGSLHWLGDDIMFDEDVFRASTADDIATAYFTELETMVRSGGFDVLAHADVFKRVATQVYGPLDTTRWESLIRPVWQACIDTGIGIEINTASLRRNVSEPHPAPEALRWYREMGGEILTLGSDAHQPAQVGYALDQAVAVARGAGFSRVPIFERRQVVRWAAI